MCLISVSWQMQPQGQWMVEQLNCAVLFHRPPPERLATGSCWSVVVLADSVGPILVPTESLCSFKVPASLIHSPQCVQTSKSERKNLCLLYVFSLAGSLCSVCFSEASVGRDQSRSRCIWVFHWVHSHTSRGFWGSGAAAVAEPSGCRRQTGLLHMGQTLRISSHFSRHLHWGGETNVSGQTKPNQMLSRSGKFFRG